jgi:hypothetical protein
LRAVVTCDVFFWWGLIMMKFKTDDTEFPSDKGKISCNVTVVV